MKELRHSQFLPKSWRALRGEILAVLGAYGPWSKTKSEGRWRLDSAGLRHEGTSRWNLVVKVRAIETQLSESEL